MSKRMAAKKATVLRVQVQVQQREISSVADTDNDCRDRETYKEEQC